jgi:proteasome lid subunit RPN8/RPN11
MDSVKGVGEPAGIMRAADRLVLPIVLWQQIQTHLAAELPNEGVGLLGATLHSDGDEVVAKATRFLPGRNLRASPSRFDLDVRDLVAALDEIERVGEVLGAIVHSHPRGEPSPSATDLAEANYPEALMMIVSFAEREPRIGVWRLEGEMGSWRPRMVPIEYT